jgi:hypothetical protein
MTREEAMDRHAIDCLCLRCRAARSTGENHDVDTAFLKGDSLPKTLLLGTSDNFGKEVAADHCHSDRTASRGGFDDVCRTRLGHAIHCRSPRVCAFDNCLKFSGGDRVWHADAKRLPRILRVPTLQTVSSQLRDQIEKASSTLGVRVFRFECRSAGRSKPRHETRFREKLQERAPPILYPTGIT